MNSISIGFYDDKPFAGSFICPAFAMQPGIRIAFQAGNEEMLDFHLEESAPDLLFISMASRAGKKPAWIRSLKNYFPSLRMIGFAYGQELKEEEIFSLINAGLSAIVSDSNSLEEILLAIECVMKHGFHMNGIVNEAMITYCKRKNLLRNGFGPEEKFTDREIKVIEEKRSGKTAVEIANLLCLSKKTVDGILQNMYSRFGCRNYQELLIRYENTLV